MTAIQILFILVAGITLGAALLVVVSRNLVHAALWLILALFGVAVIFVLLNAGFLAIVQIVIYIGAIAILIIFAIMLTRRVANDFGPQVNPNWMWAVLVSVGLFACLSWLLSKWPGSHAVLPEMSATADPLRQLGLALVSRNAYAIPFEVTSVLLLAALIGAIMIAREQK